MKNKLKIALIYASLPSYFPEKFNVWARAEATLSKLCEELGTDLFVYPEIPMDGRDTLRALEICQNANVDFILLLHGGFTMGDVARTIAASPFRAGFWSVPEPIRTGDIQLNNFVSLNMSMSIARHVRDLEFNPIQWYHGAPESTALQMRLRTTFRALLAVKAISHARVGVIGGLAMTFYNMEVSSNLLRERLGIDVTNHDMHELTNRMASQPDERINKEILQMLATAPVDGVTEAQMKLTAQAALALRDIAKQNNYDALAVSDWPALQDSPGMHPGAAFTLLEEVDHLPVASEGDILGAVTQLAAKSLTGRVGYLLDMTEPDLDTEQLLMWHAGGGPVYLADSAGARWINHPMIGRGTAAGAVYGAIADLVFCDGPVSVFRIARDAGALFQMTANIVGRDPSGFDGCRGWLESFDISGTPAKLEDVIATVMAHGLEHHFVLVPGDISAELAEFGAWSGLAPLTFRPMRNHLLVTDFSG